MVIAVPSNTDARAAARTAVKADATGRPKVSLVSVTVDPAPALLRALSNRAERWSHLRVELIVVCRGRHRNQSLVAAIVGGAHVIYGSVDAGEAELRALGLAAATGEVVMLVDNPIGTDDESIEHLSLTGTLTGLLDESTPSPSSSGKDGGFGGKGRESP